LLSGMDRSSGSSEWLKDMFLAGNYDAMVNYECLIIDADKELVSQGKEPLYAVYPYDGLSIADSPLGYVDHGSENKQKAFLAVQEYLLFEDVQNEIQKTGRRTGFEGVSEENKDIFNPDWGIDTQRILSPVTMPSEQVLKKALNLYQTEFRKPSLNVYCLDFSGSMAG
ncbi:MAG: VWA domain-containing protein, partial [Ruminococcus sp.]